MRINIVHVPHSSLARAVNPRNVAASRVRCAQSLQHSRDAWAASVRSITGRRKHKIWQPSLDPPALLSQVVVVLVNPKLPVTIGTVARACSCFECEEIRIVEPRCDQLQRSARNSSKGAQYLLHSSKQFSSLQAALQDCHLSVAFARWSKNHPHLQRFQGVEEMVRNSTLVDLIHAQPPSGVMLGQKDIPGEPRAEGSPGGKVSKERAECLRPGIGAGSAGRTQHEEHRHDPHEGSNGPKVALVFGREESGMKDEELAVCDAVCSIPIGRLQESLSLSHAVSLALSQIFQARLQAMEDSSPWLLHSDKDLAAGWENSGSER